MREATFNWIMLTPDEHMYYHQYGYEKFLQLFPHCAQRIKNAFDEGGQLYPLDLQKALENLEMITEGNKEKSEENFPNFNTMQPISTEDLADQALEDIF